MDAIYFLNLEYVFLRIIGFFQNFDIVALLNTLIDFIEMIRPISIVFIIFFLYIIVYSRIRLNQLREEEDAKFHAVRTADALVEAGTDPVLNKKWQTVQAHINSNNPSDWRLAILEADIMLGDILEKMGYQGDSIGEKLKGIEKSDFLTLDDAWEAHRIRNQIAHEGGDFKLNERDARRIIGLYEKVFSEFYYI